MTPHSFSESLRPPLDGVRNFLLQAADARELSASIVAYHDPSRAPEYYALELWPGLTEATIRGYETRVAVEFADAYREFLLQVNGATIGGLSVMGIPPSLLRDPPVLDRRTRQPLDIATANHSWRHNYAANPDHLHFAGLEWSAKENAGLFMDRRGEILGVLKSGSLVQSWSGLEGLLAFGLGTIHRSA